MKNKRRIYLRKKNDYYIFEGKRKGKTEYIWTIPKDYQKFLLELTKSSFFTRDKATKIREILSRLDYKTDIESKEPSKVRTTKIMSNLEKDDDNDDIDDELNELVGRV